VYAAQVRAMGRQLLGFILKLFAIIIFFIPLLVYSAYLISAHGDQVNVLHLAVTEQCILLALLLLPIFAWRHFDVFSVRHTDAHAREPQVME